jgi:DNA-binding transcriptional LysR family regulator
MTLNQFSSFAAVAKHLSLTKASAELRVSQPSLSLQLKQLEDHHGAKIYRRVSKGVETRKLGRFYCEWFSHPRTGSEIGEGIQKDCWESCS